MTEWQLTDDVVDAVVRHMNGDHAVLGVAYDLSEAIGGIGIPVLALCLGTFVSFIQAFVFTLLSVVYVALSVGHGDEHH